MRYVQLKCRQCKTDLTACSIGENIIRNSTPTDDGLVSSRQGEFHPKPLTELYVIVSHHTALLIQLLLLVGVSNVPVVK